MPELLYWFGGVGLVGPPEPDGGAVKVVGRVVGSVVVVELGAGARVGPLLVGSSSSSSTVFLRRKSRSTEMAPAPNTAISRASEPRATLYSYPPT